MSSTSAYSKPDHLLFLPHPSKMGPQNLLGLAAHKATVTDTKSYDQCSPQCMVPTCSASQWSDPLAGKPWPPAAFQVVPHLLGPLAQSAHPWDKSLTWLLSPESSLLCNLDRPRSQTILRPAHHPQGGPKSPSTSTALCFSCPS